MAVSRFKIGDNVRIVKIIYLDDLDDVEYKDLTESVGKIGVITRIEIEMLNKPKQYPFTVEFDSGNTKIYHIDEIELLDKSIRVVDKWQ